MIYDSISGLAHPERSILYTVITGENRGAHAVFADGEAVCLEPGFPENFLQDASAPTEFSCGKMQLPCIVESEGGARIFAECPGADKKAVICGGGYVAQEVLKLLKGIGFFVTLVDDRPSFGREAKANGADQILIGPFEEMLASLSSDEDTYCVIMTRGHRYDMECLSWIMRQNFAYAGMLSSRSRAAAAKREMAERGIPEEKLKLLHSPIGLSIGAETPQEIAVSVAAEIIAEKSGRGSSSIPCEIRNALSEGGKKVMALIVGRKGSAPRGAGTRMLITEDGRLFGTIGGGCFEAEVVRRARDMMSVGEKTELVTVSLTEEDIMERGMACGGTMEVFLETIQ